jgi:hypothetical protein
MVWRLPTGPVYLLVCLRLQLSVELLCFPSKIATHSLGHPLERKQAVVVQRQVHRGGFNGASRWKCWRIRLGTERRCLSLLEIKGLGVGGLMAPSSNLLDFLLSPLCLHPSFSELRVETISSVRSPKDYQRQVPRLRTIVVPIRGELHNQYKTATNERRIIEIFPKDVDRRRNILIYESSWITTPVKGR